MDTRILLLLLYLLNNNTNTSSQDTLHNIKNYLYDIEIKKDYTKEKIRIAKKVLPLVPEQYSSTFNRSLLITEKVVKVMEVQEFLSLQEKPVKTLDLEPKERLQRILYTIQDEARDSDINEFGTVLDLILNIDNYKKMLSAFTNLNKGKNSMTDSEKISMLMEVFMTNSNEKDREKVNDMMKMFDMLKVLNDSDDTENKEDKPNGD